MKLLCLTVCALRKKSNTSTYLWKSTWVFFIYKNFLMFYSRIIFHFEPNPYIENDVLIKELHLGNPREYYFYFVSYCSSWELELWIWTITHDIFNIQFNLIKSALFNLSVRVTQTSFGKKLVKKAKHSLGLGTVLQCMTKI